MSNQYSIESNIRKETTQCWWVNQGASYLAEKMGGFIWAPVTNKAGTPLSHHTDLKKVKVGDFVFHYSDKHLRAIGVVKKEFVNAERPQGLPVGAWVNQGYLVEVDYNEFNRPIPLEEIPVGWRIAEKKPFNRAGGVNQGYFYPVSSKFAIDLVQKLQSEIPEALQVESDLEETSPEIKTDLGNSSRQDLTWETIRQFIIQQGMRISEDILKRYHLSLKTRGFVVLSGISGTGKTWLTETYAQAIDAEYCIVPVAPNWTSNEDLLGYLNPIDGEYHDTDFSLFVRQAEQEYLLAKEEKREPRPFHVVLDEMNLARVEYYFAKFLSLMEIRMREKDAFLELSKDEKILLPPNLYVIGTVNVDETTHGFADKVFDRAQLIELQVRKDDLSNYIGDTSYRDLLLQIWQVVLPVAPFAFRVVDEIKKYVFEAEKMGMESSEALDIQILQKILPKLKGSHREISDIFTQLEKSFKEAKLMKSLEKLTRMQKGFKEYGVVSYF